MTWYRFKATFLTSFRSGDWTSKHFQHAGITREMNRCADSEMNGFAPGEKLLCSSLPLQFAANGTFCLTLFIPNSPKSILRSRSHSTWTRECFGNHARRDGCLGCPVARSATA